MAKKPVYQKLPANYEGNFEALMHKDTYVAEAQHLHNSGIDRAGMHGVSCPKCYKQIQAIEFGTHTRGKAWCACKDKERPFVDEIRLALGFPTTSEHPFNRGPARAM